MAISKKQKKIANNLRKEMQLAGDVFYKDLSKVFVDHGEFIFKSLTKIDDETKETVDQFAAWQVLKNSIKKVFSKQSKKLSNRFTRFFNKLFGYDLEESEIEETAKKVKSFYDKTSNKKIANILDKTKEQIYKVVSENKELGQRELAKLIKNKFNEISQGRAKTIARTETANIFNFNNDETAKAGGMGFKTWVHTGLGAVDRKTHLAINGVKVKFDEFFEVGSELGLYPHDAGLSAENVINCNCVIIYSKR